MTGVQTCALPIFGIAHVDTPKGDLNADGMVEYEEFIPLALQIVQSIYAKKALEAHVDHVEQQAQTLVHGMSREELTACIQTMFEEIDVEGTGLLGRAQFVQALMGMELGLTRKELNAIMFQVDEDQDGFISYREFARFAYDLLQKLTSLRLLDGDGAGPVCAVSRGPLQVARH